jgi:hypothetical protein
MESIIDSVLVLGMRKSNPTPGYKSIWQKAMPIITLHLAPIAGSREAAVQLLVGLWRDERIRARYGPFQNARPPEVDFAMRKVLPHVAFNVDDIRRELAKMRKAGVFAVGDTSEPVPTMQVTKAEATSANIVAIARELGVTPEMNANLRTQKISALCKERYGMPVGHSKIAEALRGTGMIRSRPPRGRQPD